jgi:hypothetical protein
MIGCWWLVGDRLLVDWFTDCLLFAVYLFVCCCLLLVGLLFVRSSLFIVCCLFVCLLVGG